MRRFLVGLFLAAVALAVWWGFRSGRRPLEEAYIGERSVTVWSSTAQVREGVAVLHYGAKVAVLGRSKELVQVRTAEGAAGWVEQDQLLDLAVWQRIEQLRGKARALPVQARGHTRVLSNVRIEPGRTAPRIYQFGRAVPVEVLARGVAESVVSAEETSSSKEVSGPGSSAGEQRASRREDWLLVRGRVEGVGEVAGWILGRFVELDLPEPLPEYASSAGMRVVAWFELNRVRDAQQGEKSQYLAAGVKGAEGQPCDFTLLRVYTWSTVHKRHETAYVESNLCGRLPIRVRQQGSDVFFRFTAVGRTGDEDRLYRMHQTVVCRVRTAERR